MDLAYNGSWHDTTNGFNDTSTTLEVKFTGIGIYVYGILANDLGVYVGTKANYSFLLDGLDAGRFVHEAELGDEGYRYNVPCGSSTLTIS